MSLRVTSHPLFLPIYSEFQIIPFPTHMLWHCLPPSVTMSADLQFRIQLFTGLYHYLPAFWQGRRKWQSGMGKTFVTLWTVHCIKISVLTLNLWKLLRYFTHVYMEYSGRNNWNSIFGSLFLHQMNPIMQGVARKYHKVSRHISIWQRQHR